MQASDKNSPRSVAVIVAHPDDETLWAGGTILAHSSWNWHIVTLCRASDPDRAPRFHRALRELGATGSMGDLDDGPEQDLLDPEAVRQTVLGLLPASHFDLIISHNPRGEYTRHRRHEEAAAAVIWLWYAGRLSAPELWAFAYEDGRKTHLPLPIADASIYTDLPEDIWHRKYGIITGTYGFTPGSFEGLTTPRAEAFWKFTDPSDAKTWLDRGGGAPA